ncbi:MAG: hypothetical protein KAT25_06045 [Sulfuriflexus sp.]|nr:hypothetical protein [Sulfuriflexus sp.]
MRKSLPSSLFIHCMLFISLTATASNAGLDANKNQLGFKVTAKQVLGVMNKWARAWAQLDARTYISSYSPDYIGQGFPSHFTWAANRQHHLENQKSINLSLTDVEILSDKQGLFTITFTQHYQSNNYQDTTRKQLDFKLIKNDWYIVAEKSLPKLK